MPIARPLGFVQWICPDCGCGHGSVPLNWRNGRIRCHHCRRTFVLGLNFTSRLAVLPPHNAIYVPGPPAAGYVNRRDGVGQPAVGRVVGVVQWQCPGCDRIWERGSAVEWTTGALTCLACHTTYHVGMILYRPVQGARATTPPDWIPPYGTTQTAEGAAPAEAAGASS